jgi:predicted anti-sigma-YlaC factor YlaD
MTEAHTCEEIREILPELAAGVADGGDRAATLAHLANCPGCRRELDQLTAVLDGLVLLAPEHQPAPGFETSVLESLLPARAAQPRRLQTLVLAAAAAAVVAILAGGIVWWNTSDDRQLASQYRDTLSTADGRYLVAANISTATGTTVGHAFAYEGTPAWLFVTIQSAAASGNYQVELVTDDHQTIDLGWCDVKAGRGAWGTTVPVPVSDISRIQLSRSGAATMDARFH